MKLAMFTVYDSKAEAFLPPFYAGNTGMAKRVFADSTKKAEHQFAKNPADYTLMELGTWDDETAKFEQLKTPKSLGLAMEYQRTQKETTQIDLELVENS